MSAHLRLFILVALSFPPQGCARYIQLAPGLAINSETSGGNWCRRDAGAEVAAAYFAVRDAARAAGVVRRWPPETIKVCVVDARPFVVCGSVALAGCAWPRQVYVARHWAPPPHERLQRSYSWRSTLVHELIGALTLQGVLGLPLPERDMVKSQAYRALHAATLAAISSP